jgi:phosphatidylglycerol:prolipoprotein diacylglycerol transferase
MLAQVHPVLFHIGAMIIPAYGAFAAVGMLFALMLAQRTARTVDIDPNQIWTLSIVALFVGLAGSRIVLILANWPVLRSHPLWIFNLAMIHHPLVATCGALFALAAAWLYAIRQRLPLRTTADALSAPFALMLSFEQIGALLAGSSFGSESTLPWAVTYTNLLAARWSGAPLGIPVHPVQAYAAIAFLTISICLLLLLPNRRKQGDVAGAFLIATGVIVYITEFWRSPEGRGVLLGGALNGPQAAAVVLVIAGALVLRNHKGHTAINLNAADTRSTSHEATHG